MKNEFDIEEILILGQRMGFFKEENKGYFLSENSKNCHLQGFHKPLEEFIGDESRVGNFLSLVGNPSISEKDFDSRILEYTINEKQNSFSKIMKDNFENVKSIALSTGQAPPVVILGVGFLLREMCLKKDYIGYKNGQWYSKLKQRTSP